MSNTLDPIEAADRIREVVEKVVGDDEEMKSSIRDFIFLMLVLKVDSQDDDFLQRELKDLTNCVDTIYKEVKKYGDTKGFRESGYLDCL